MSHGREMHSPPFAARARAVASHASALRDEIYTFAPDLRKPCAIIRPIPREPPVTRAMRSLRENRLFSMTDDAVSLMVAACLKTAERACSWHRNASLRGSRAMGVLLPVLRQPQMQRPARAGLVLSYFLPTGQV